jgi:hypothetical protein
MDKQKTKSFDAVGMKRQIQEQIYDETRYMSPEELLTYFRARIAKSRFADFLTDTGTSQPHPDARKVSHGV